MKPDFTRKLLKWNEAENRRQMPWKGEKDPYKIWLSEIILQQTRVEQGWAYYNKFITEFPTVKQLAKAPDEKVFKLWEGLGYYSRCKNLLETARIISHHHKGVFPADYQTIRQLKGIGPYTAAAIASFAFNLPYAVVDGNVQRVLARYFGISTPVDSTAGKKLFDQLAQALLDKESPALYNQAIMDFGATICKPQNPLCDSCIQKKECVARKLDQVRALPVKEKSLVKKDRHFFYYIILYDKQVYVRKRTGKDIWQNLYEFVLFEAAGNHDNSSLTFLQQITGKKNAPIVSEGKVYRQQLSHQTIHGRFMVLSVTKPTAALKDYTLVDLSKIDQLPFPVLINQYLQSAPDFLSH